VTDLIPLLFDLPDEAATRRLGAALADRLRPGDVVALGGDLGAGKSTLARALIQALAGPDTEVPSPTFTLVQVYDTPGARIWHFDLYRLEHPDDAVELDIDDAFAEGISLIEWPERLGSLLPARRIDIELAPGAGPMARVARLTPYDTDTKRWQDLK